MEILADGTFRMCPGCTLGSAFGGEYSADAHEVFFYEEPCPMADGHYTWSFDGEQLIFTAVSPDWCGDTPGDRQIVMESAPWEPRD